MKHNKILSYAILGSYVLLAAACVEEVTTNEDKYRPVGTPIVFSASTGYDNGIDTRAEYSGELFGDTPKYERIDWEEGDPIHVVYKNNAEGDYTVTSGSITPANEISYADLTGNTLTWDGSGNHIFYALYPSGGNANGELTTAGKVSGQIPATQNVDPDHTLSVTVDNLTFDKYQPNTQEYGYMAAYETITEGDEDYSVKLRFRPAFTAFEFKFDRPVGSPDKKVASFEMKTEDLGNGATPLYGKFSLTIDGNNGRGATWSAAPTVTGGGNIITVAFPTGGVSIPEKGTGYLDFSILALPVDQTGVVLTLNYVDNTSKSVKLKDGMTGPGVGGTWHIFKGAKKYILTTTAPGGTVSEWNYFLFEVDSEGVLVDPPTDLKAGEVRTGHAGHIGDYPVQVRPKPFKSYKVKKTDPTDQDFVNVEIQYAEANEDGTNSENWSYTKPDWLSEYSWRTPVEGTGDTPADTIWQSQAKYTVLPIKVLHEGATGLDKYETFNEIKEHTRLIRANTDNGRTTDAPQDLALYDIDKLTARNPNSHPKTANCYVVDRTGWYQFPLVYGNAIDWDHSPANNGWNPSSWKDNDNGVTGISLYRLAHFQNFIAKAIQSPYILDDVNSEVSDQHLTIDDLEAVIVWEDTATPFIDPDDVKIVPTPTTTAVYYEQDGTTPKVVPYIKFRVNGNIMQGNAVIAVREKAGSNRILWSWHIWITELDMGTVFFPQRGGAVTGNDMMKYNLGWCDMRIGRMYSYVPRICYAKISHTESESDAEPLVFKITEKLDPYYTITQSSGTYYQMGRKDPYPPGTSNEGLSWGWIGYFDNNGEPAPTYSNAELTVLPHSSTGSALPRYINKPMYAPIYPITEGTGGLVHQAASSSEDNMAHVIQHPNITYTRNVSTTIGWLYNNRPWNLWDMYNLVNLQYRGSGGTLLSDWTPIWQYDRIPAKTIYDPCPPGFVVANYAAYSGASEHGSNLHWGPDLNGGGPYDDGDTWCPEDAVTFPDIPLYGDYRFYFNSSAGTKSICFPSHGYRSDGTIGGIFGGIYNLTSQKKGDRYVICLSGWGPVGGGNSRQTSYAVRPIKEHPVPTPPEPGNAYIYPVLPD